MTYSCSFWPQWCTQIYCEDDSGCQDLTLFKINTLTDINFRYVRSFRNDLKQSVPAPLLMLPWCQSLFIYFKGKHHCRPWLYFQKNPISKAVTLPLIHCFQPLAAWTPERKPRPLPTRHRTHILLLLNAQMMVSAYRVHPANPVKVI